MGIKSSGKAFWKSSALKNTTFSFSEIKRSLTISYSVIHIVLRINVFNYYYFYEG